MKTDSFWVVERFEDGKSAGYWDGASSRSFIADIDSAVHFCRKQDAFWTTRGWHWRDTEITEHVMLDRTVPHTAAPRELTLQDFGYAPGNYAIKCLDCGQEALWCDKRAARCETCAKQALAENRTLPNEAVQLEFPPKLRADCAAALAHRGCCGTEHDPANGKLHGYCVVCGVPWPCETAQYFLRKPT